MITDDQMGEWVMIPQEAFLYFPEGDDIKIGSGEKQWRKIFEDGSPYDSFENKKVEELEEKMEQMKIVPHQWFTKANKLRFLQANKFKIDDTCKSIKQGSLWRKNSFPLKDNPQAFNKLNEGALYFCGRDLQYRPILIVEITKMKRYSQQIIPAVLNTLLEYAVDHLLIPGQIENYVLFINLDGAGISDKGSVQKIVSFTGNTYRSRLYASYLLNTPFLIASGWNAFASAFVSENTMRKIKISKEQSHEDMWKHIDKDIVERKYGGNMANLTQNFWPPSKKLMNFCSPQAKNNLTTKEKYNKALSSGQLKGRKVKQSLVDKPKIQPATPKPKEKKLDEQLGQKIESKEDQIKKTQSKNQIQITNVLPAERIRVEQLPPIKKRTFQLFFQKQQFKNLFISTNK